MPSNMIKHSSNFLTDLSKAVILWIFFVICVSCLSVILYFLFLASMWSPAGKGMTSWFSCISCFLVFYHFPIWYLGQVWYSIVSISDLCLLAYFYAW